MFAFHPPPVTSFCTSRPSFLPLRHAHPKVRANSIKYARIPCRCEFDPSSEISTVSETHSYPLLSNAKIVTVKLPLDIYLEETADGRVFIDELVPGGSAEASGLLREGDVIVAVSLPFGDGLFPVPKTEALDMVASYITSRQGDTFSLAIVRTETLEQLRAQDAQQPSIPVSKMQSCMKQVHIQEYPIAPPQDHLSTSDPNFKPDLEALREYGFDIDELLNAPEFET